MGNDFSGFGDLTGNVQIEAGNFPDDPYIDDLNRQLRQNLLNQLPPQIPTNFSLPIPNIGLYQLSLPQYGGNRDPIAQAIARFSYKNKPSGTKDTKGKDEGSNLFTSLERYSDTSSNDIDGSWNIWDDLGTGMGGGARGDVGPYGGFYPRDDIGGGGGVGQTVPWANQTAQDMYTSIADIMGYPYSGQDPTPSGPPVGGVNQGQSRGQRIANLVSAGLGGLGDILAWYQDKRNADKYRRFVEQQRAEQKALADQYSSPENFLYLLKTFLPRAREISSGGGAALESTVASGLARSGMTGTGIGQALQGGAAGAGQMEALRLAASLAGQSQQQQLATLGLPAFDPYNPMARQAFQQPGLGEALQAWAARSGLMGRALAGGRGGNNQADQDRFWARILRQMGGQQSDDDTIAL